MHVSDLDVSADGLRWGIEWEFEDGGRFWQWFDTYEEREAELEDEAVREYNRTGIDMYESSSLTARPW